MNAPMRFENTRVWWIKTCKPYNFSFENCHQQPNVAFGTTKVAMSSALTLELTGTLAALKKKSISSFPSPLLQIGDFPANPVGHSAGSTLG